MASGYRECSGTGELDGARKSEVPVNAGPDRHCDRTRLISCPVRCSHSRRATAQCTARWRRAGGPKCASESVGQWAVSSSRGQLGKRAGPGDGELVKCKAKQSSDTRATGPRGTGRGPGGRGEGGQGTGWEWSHEKHALQFAYCSSHT